MKRNARFVFPLLAVLLLVQCSSAPNAQTDALNGLKTVRAGVEGALAVFNAGYQAGTYSDTQRDQLKDLYTKYLAIDKIAAEALNATTATNTAEIIQKVTVAASDVIKFIQLLKGTP